jgi:AraC-like DNA-binding protein
VPGRLTRLSKIDATGTSGAPRPRLKPRGLPPALRAHGVYSTDNPAEAALYGRDLLGMHRVRPLDPTSRDFIATFHGVLIRDVTLGYLEYGTSVVLDVLELTEDYLVIVPASGTSTITNEGITVEASPVVATVPRPGTAMTLSCDADAAHLIVRIARSPLQIHLSRLIGRTLQRPLDFDLRFDIASGNASRWNFAVQMLHAELFEPDSLLLQGIGQGQLEEFVMSSLLYSLPSNYTEQLTNRSEPAHRAVRAACDFIDRNLSDPITVDDIARAGGVSVRTMQHLFAQQLGQSPTNYLKNERLERARSDLADAPGDSRLTVTDVAMRWGFSHLGRFATTYRHRFGESPSQTLRR